MNTAKLVAALYAGLLVYHPSRASDWPQFLGPTRNAVYPGNDLAERWPQEGPPVVWHRPVGHGWSGPVVSERKVALCYREGDRDTVVCLDARTGNQIWKFDY